MEWFDSPDYWLTRAILGRALAGIYLVAFLVALHQFRPLLGERGLLPAPDFLRAVRFRDAPSLFHVGYSDRLLVVVALAGIILSATLVLGLPQAASLPATMVAWAVLWVLYLSIVNVGQAFYSFGWESLLLEAGFLAIFLGDDRTAPPALVLWLFRWLAFRVEFGAGLIKLRGDRCWRDLTCMDYHHETQPMPNPLSWYFHRLPRPLHRVEVIGNYVAQLVAPIGLFLPQPIAAISALLMIATQAYLVTSGNYAWLNVITIVVAVAAIPDDLIRLLIPVAVPVLAPQPDWFFAIVVAVTGLVVALSYWPVRNLISPGQLMNYPFNPLHLVNTYGAFGSVTRRRYEVVVEGTRDEPAVAAGWREYGFKGKPSDPTRRPRQYAPYHLRLDWLMWFAALSPGYAQTWFVRFMEKLLQHDRAVRRLLDHDPFPESPPRYVRAQLYLYRYTTWREHRDTGHWWSRTLVGDYLPPVRLSGEG